MKKFFMMLAVLFTALQVMAQQPVKVTHEVELDGDKGTIEFVAEIAEGYHMYSTDIPAGGPKPTSLKIREIEGAELVGSLLQLEEPETEFDQSFEMTVGYFEYEAVFSQKFKVTGENYRIKGTLSYQSCREGACMPGRYDFEISGKGIVVAPAAPAKTEKAVEPKKQMVAQEHLLFKGIPIQGDFSSFLKRLDEKGIHDIGDLVYYGDFAGYKVYVDIFGQNKSDVVYSVDVTSMPFDGKEATVLAYNYFKDLYTRKYGEPEATIEGRTSYPPSDPFVEKMWTLYFESVSIGAIWRNDAGEIELYIQKIDNREFVIKIRYFDYRSYEEAISQPMKDI